MGLAPAPSNRIRAKKKHPGRARMLSCAPIGNHMGSYPTRTADTMRARRTLNRRPWRRKESCCAVRSAMLLAPFLTCLACCRFALPRRSRAELHPDGVNGATLRDDRANCKKKFVIFNFLVKICILTYSSMRSNISLPTPQMGQVKSSGSSSTYSMWPQMVQRQANLGAAASEASPAKAAASAAEGSAGPS